MTGELILLAASLLVPLPPLARLSPPYAAGYSHARPDYHRGRSRPPYQPWYFLPRPVLDRRGPSATAAP